MLISDLGLPGDLRVTGLAVDSREVRPGALFFALPGTQAHGAGFARAAIAAGAAAIVTDARGVGLIGPGPAVPVLRVEDPRLVLAQAAATWFGAQPQTVVAVTGTNGKTSTASFVRQIWQRLGLSAVNFGTTGLEGARTGGIALTTPEPITLHRLLAELAADRVTHAAMEASSHGLAQRRLDGVRLTAAGFTNLSRDHLDYHADTEDYFAAKLGLFSRVLGPDGTAVVNVGDPFGRRVLDAVKARGQRAITFGGGGDLAVLDQRFGPASQTIRLRAFGGVHMVDLGLIGAFQAENALAAAGLAIATGCAPDAVAGALGALTGVRGRMELAATRANGAHVYVDYSHTPGGVEAAIAALRPHASGRIIIVVGAGGDRDPGKRPMMGRAAAAADLAYITDDNPRSEDPAAIRAAVMAGCPGATEVGDRAEAILRAVDAADAGDTVLIAGKGHETGQIVGDTVLPFDDREMASVAARTLDGAGA